jgi:hypothetical protein
MQRIISVCDVRGQRRDRYHECGNNDGNAKSKMMTRMMTVVKMLTLSRMTF